MTATPRLARQDTQLNPNALHESLSAKKGPKNIPKQIITSTKQTESPPKDPGYPYANTTNISFKYYNQRKSNAPFGYSHFISLPPSYNSNTKTLWPLILFLHGAGQSQRGTNESYASLRHGIPKVILCYDKLKSGNSSPSINIPLAPRLRSKSRQTKYGDDMSDEPVDAEVCTTLAENFITVTPSLNMDYGYGWNASILSALLDEIVERYHVDVDRIHVTGFSMGGYGTWDLGLYSPDRFATLMPICGGGDPVRASLIAHVPQWVHHGDKDNIIPLKASQQMVDALEKAGAPEVKFSWYPELMHDSWTEAYNNIEVYQWMLSRRRQVKGNEKVVPEENKVVVTASSES